MLRSSPPDSHIPDPPFVPGTTHIVTDAMARPVHTTFYHSHSLSPFLAIIVDGGTPSAGGGGHWESTTQG